MESKRRREISTDLKAMMKKSAAELFGDRAVGNVADWGVLSRTTKDLDIDETIAEE